MRKILLILLLSPLFSYSQGIFLICKRDTIHINRGYIGFTTKSFDTIRYDSKSGLGSIIHSISFDTLFIKTPKKYRDTLIPFINQGLPVIGKPFRYLGSTRINKVRMAKIALIEETLIQYVLLDSITSISYPPKGSENSVGCIFCVFVPIYNYFYLRSLRTHYIPKTYSIPCWEIIVLN